jgi:hypothetical protein
VKFHLSHSPDLPIAIGGFAATLALAVFTALRTITRTYSIGFEVARHIAGSSLGLEAYSKICRLIVSDTQAVNLTIIEYMAHVGIHAALQFPCFDMSAPGQSRHIERAPATSAVHPIADISPRRTK